MARSATNTGKDLPEPSHPFARWFGGAVVGIWALGVQSLPDPWNKVGAILSPGVGYIFGHGVEICVYWFRDKSDRIANKRNIDNLYQQLNDARSNGANIEIIQFLQELILVAHRGAIKIDGAAARTRKVR